MTKKVRFAIIGLGGMGRFHSKTFLEGGVPRGELVAVCDPMADLDTLFPSLARFRDPEALFASGLVDAVLIATPHYSHTSIGIAALSAGLHVLVEKPISVHKADAAQLIGTPRKPGQLFGAMFQMRVDPRFRKVKEMLEQGELGKVSRMQWAITDWYRTEFYYQSASWRATWEGEGGGVLLNQCPHQLDLWQWLFGMPSQIYTQAHFGKHHRIGVEDEVTAVMEYPEGVTGLFITSTGEFPGVNCLEIIGERGRLVVPKEGPLRFQRTEIPVPEHTATSKTWSSGPAVCEMEIPIGEEAAQHAVVIRNFCDAILDGAPLVAPAEEGIHSVELANTMLFSAFHRCPVALPLDAEAYAAELEKKIALERSSQ